MPFTANSDDGTGIVYAWIGSNSDPEDARLIGEIAEEMFNNVSHEFSVTYSPKSSSPILSNH